MIFSFRPIQSIVYLLVRLYIPLFLKEITQFVSKLCRNLWRALSQWSKYIKLFSYLLLSLGEMFWGSYCHFSVSLLFYVPQYLENHQIASHQFSTDVLGITQRVPLKKTFSQHLYLSWEPFWGILVLILGYACASVLESCSASYLMKFYTDAFCITSDSQCAKKNFVARITLYFSLHPLGILGLFWVYSWMSWETFSWYFAQMSWYCCGDH